MTLCNMSEMPDGDEPSPNAGSIAFSLNLCASTITVEPILSQKTTKGCKADHVMIHGVWGYYGHRVIFGKFKL